MLPCGQTEERTHMKFTDTLRVVSQSEWLSWYSRIAKCYSGLPLAFHMCIAKACREICIDKFTFAFQQYSTGLPTHQYEDHAATVHILCTSTHKQTYTVHCKPNKCPICYWFVWTACILEPVLVGGWMGSHKGGSQGGFPHHLATTKCN